MEIETGNNGKQIIGLMLVRNDDRFVGQALRNVLGFCDKVLVLDHASTDHTLERVEAVAASCREKVEVHRIADVEESHAFVLPFVGKPVWLLAVDGDEIYDPSGLARLRHDMLRGEYDRFWRLYGHVLNVTHLDSKRKQAKGYSSPPGHSMTKLYNMEAIESWEGAPQRLHGGTMVLKPQWDLKSGIHAFFHRTGWEESLFRCLHMVFVRRSSRQITTLVRLCPADLLHHRSLGVTPWERAKLWSYWVWMALRRKSGKDKVYRKGPLVERDAEPFFEDGNLR